MQPASQTCYAGDFIDLFRVPQVVFKKLLTAVQWMSLCLLTFGCIVNRLDFGHIFGGEAIVGEAATATASPSVVAFRLDPFMLLIVLQAVCSCLAGVYNEYILKNQGADVDIYVQNAYMYLDSILANVLFMYNTFGWMPSASDDVATADDHKASVWTPTVMLVMLNNACIGIVTSFFLKYLNSILKTFASALELVFTAVLCYALFGIPITVSTAASIAIVSAAIYLYTCAPVKSANRRLAGVKRRRDASTELLGNSDEENEDDGNDRAIV